jgi:coenzyme F420-reducing hydrogenase delta subunit/ferredoxin
MWIHIQRISRPRTNPPRSLAVGLFAALTLLALARPVASDAQADLALVPSIVNLDWVYQAIHPLLYASSGTVLWVLAGALTIALAALPWLPPGKRPVVARVDLANCNGCGRCFADCPYVAVTMRPRSDGRALAREAFVDADLCAACGICAGACPSSTPFRTTDAPRTGIDLPQYPMHELRDRLERQLAALRGTPKVVVFGCDCAASLAALARDDTTALSMPCSGMLPPSFVEYALRGGADGVLVTGCREDDCAYRLGNRWTEERLRAEREPHLRATVNAERVRIAWRGRFDGASLQADLDGFRRTLRRLHAPASPISGRRERSGG